MDIYARPGSKVIFTGKGGYPAQNSHANSVLEIGREYEVKHVSVGSWSSNVYLEGVEGSWNTTMFRDSDTDKIRLVKRVLELVDAGDRFDEVWEEVEDED
jgi:hypothetical protein